MHMDDAREASPALCSQLNKTAPSHHFSSTVPVEWASADPPMPVIHTARRRFESKGLFDPQSSWKTVRILNHLVKTKAHPPLLAPTGVRKDGKEWPKKKSWLKKRHERPKKKTQHTQKNCTWAKEALFIFVFFVRAITNVLQSEFFESDVPDSKIKV